MIGLLQRVSSASVSIAEMEIATIARGLLVLVGVEKGDDVKQAERLAERLLNYRVFADETGRMNDSICDVKGELLLVPQFTLAADTSKGNRPGFSSAAEAAHGEVLFNHLVAATKRSGLTIGTGRFGADMQVRLCNDGPVTFQLRVPPGEPAE